LAILACAGTVRAASTDWPGFRGLDGTGVSAETGLPVTWTKSKHIAWKVALPGRGLSSPIVVGGHVIVTCCSGVAQDTLHVISFDARNGAKQWERRIWATGRTMCHPKTCMAAPTPVSDGRRVFALFATCDVVCLDLDGNTLWLRALSQDYPGIGNNVGLASSPVVVNGTFVALLENDGNSFAIGIDTATGWNRWRILRERLFNHATPGVWRGAERNDDAVLLQTTSGISAHDPGTGVQRWVLSDKCAGIPSSCVHDGMIIVPGEGVVALRPDPDTGSPAIAWRSRRVRPGTASPVIYGGRVYAVNSGGIVSCADLATGKNGWKLRIKGPFSASPVAADGRLYFVNEKGLCQVVEPGEKAGKVVGESDLGELILATPAVSGSALFIRSDGHLWKIAQE